MNSDLQASPTSLPETEVDIRVFRYDPSNAAPVYREYRLPVQKGTTVLDALRYIKDRIDGSLAYRASCRSAICGSCAMKINSNSKLACNTRVLSEIEKHGRLVVEPSDNMTVQKDLMVDMSPFWSHYIAVKPWLVVDPQKVVPDREYLMSPETVEAFEGTPNCIACGACFSACPAVTVDPEFPGPMALAKLYRYTIDPRDDARKERLESIADAGLWWCVRCYECVKACPKDVRPGEVITYLRESSVREGVTGDVGAKHAIAFVENIRKHGSLNEERLILESLGVGALKKLKLGTEMVLKGKYKALPFQKPIPNVEEVQTIYDEVQRLKKKERSSQ